MLGDFIVYFTSHCFAVATDRASTVVEKSLYFQVYVPSFVLFGIAQDSTLCTLKCTSYFSPESSHI